MVYLPTRTGVIAVLFDMPLGFHKGTPLSSVQSPSIHVGMTLSAPRRRCQVPFSCPALPCPASLFFSASSRYFPIHNETDIAGSPIATSASDPAGRRETRVAGRAREWLYGEDYSVRVWYGMVWAGEEAAYYTSATRMNGWMDG